MSQSNYPFRSDYVPVDHYGRRIEVGVRVAIRDGGTLRLGTVSEVRQKGGKVACDAEIDIHRDDAGRYVRTFGVGPVVNVRDLRSLTRIE